MVTLQRRPCLWCTLTVLWCMEHSFAGMLRENSPPLILMAKQFHGSRGSTLVTVVPDCVGNNSHFDLGTEATLCNIRRNMILEFILENSKDSANISSLHRCLGKQALRFAPVEATNSGKIPGEQGIWLKSPIKAKCPLLSSFLITVF